MYEGTGTINTDGRQEGRSEAKPGVDHTAIAKELIEFRLEFQLTKSVDG
jgi:hypothetical protein